MHWPYYNCLMIELAMLVTKKKILIQTQLLVGHVFLSYFPPKTCKKNAKKASLAHASLLHFFVQISKIERHDLS